MISKKDGDRLANIKAILPEIDNTYKEFAESNHFPGYAYGIVVDGQLAHSSGGGFIDLNKKTPATSKSMFRIASITKSFTAMAILKLRDEKKLQLDDPVSLYMPEMENQRLTKDAPQITVRNLLTHSSGFPTDDAWGDRKLNYSEDEFIALLKKGILFSNVPGIAYEYSNLGYTMLGYIIQKVTNKPYSQYILDGLLLKDAEWDFTKISPSQLVHGYRWINEKWEEQKLLGDGIFGAMGGMITSIEAFSRYAALHLSAWPPRDESEAGPIKRSSIREMHQPWRLEGRLIETYLDGRQCSMTSAYGYGLSWMRDDLGRVYVGHSGGLPGFGSNWTIMPDYGIGVILFANVTYAPTWKVNFDVLDKLIVGAQLKPRQIPPSNILKERQQGLIKFLPDWNDAEASGIFADNFFLDYPLDALKQEAASLFDKAGKVVSVGEVVPESQLRGSFEIKGEKNRLQIAFALAPENPAMIQQYSIKEIL